MYDFLPWADFKKQFRWKQGEHLTAVAPTGAGKTTLFSELMPYRGYNIMFGTKPADKSYDRILKNGYKRIESINEIRSYHDNYLLWPRQAKTIRETMLNQRKVFLEAMDAIVEQQSWTVWVDESKYIAEMLKLKTELTYCLEQLRSINATVICGAQRPAFLPMSALSSATHVFTWKTQLDADKKRLSDIGGINVREVMQAMEGLDSHEFLYIKTRGVSAKIIRSQVEVGRG
jgi:hypothetical protein